MKLQRETQKRLIDIIAREKDEKAAQSKLAAALKEILAAMPESEKKAVGDAGGALSEAAVNAVQQRLVPLVSLLRPALDACEWSRCPVLAINGEKDLQVPAKENLAEIDKALKAGGNLNVKTVELPGLNHLFQPCKTGSPSEYGAIETTIAPEALKTIGDWIVAQTGAKSGPPSQK